MKVKQISQWLQKNSKIKYLIRLLVIAAVAWVLGQFLSPTLMKAVFL